MPRLWLYGTAGCHLCEAAERILVEALSGQAGFPWEAVEIAGDEHLLGRYGLRIPVLRMDRSGEELDWPFDARDVAAFLEGRRHLAAVPT